MFRSDLLKGKKILVTGGGTGLGKTMATRFMELGAEVAICGRRKAVLDETAAELAEATGGRISTHAVDIRVPQAVEEMIAEIWASGPLDGLVNNAAGNFLSRTEDLSARAFDAIAGIVLHGTFYVTSACGRRWLAEGRKASVLSILTTWVWTGSPYTVPSAMSKAGVAAMTQSLAVEWGPRGIRCNAIAPGPFPTEGAWERLRIGGRKAESKDDYATNPMRRAGEQRELGNFAAFLMADECAYINGEVIAMDGGAWLNNAGNYARLWSLGDDDWKRMREQVQSQNVKDKSQRSV
ncbi:SDR family oxidoreductase [Desertibaculum subflavum]|uniref:SDR family oxidoreductase n=1 Tax=Desertibaculum subflavum TaxID=2268458 RepID=UPI0013C4DC82